MVASIPEPPDHTRALFRTGPPVKRQRLRSSCTECHRRKQKCNREKPCSNCIGRDTPEACIYESNFRYRAPVLPSNGPRGHGKRPDNGEITVPEALPIVEDGGTLSSSAADWGYGRNMGSTMNFLEQIESSMDNQVCRLPPDYGPNIHFPPRHDIALREKYRALIRQLPSKKYIDLLTASFMRTLNWQYYFIDPEIFRWQFDEWCKLPFLTFTDVGPRGIPSHLRAFPAVLFQTLALSLILVTEKNDPDYDPLRYINSMTLEDVATEYSNAGAAIVELLGTNQITLETVQAQFLRATFYKYTAKVTDAWHAISVAIRYAQDIGMDRQSMDPLPQDSSEKSTYENQWLIQRRRRLYAVLALWDLSCAVILGRPGTIDLNRPMPPLPIDARLTNGRFKHPLIPRIETDRPSPISLILWTMELVRPLQDIRDLENSEPSRALFKKVDQLHRKIYGIHANTPALFRLEDPDTQWDKHPGVHWIQAARFYFAQLQEFTLMALHRPYIFHRRESRTEAIEASLRMLEIQKQTFSGLPPDSWRNHLLFFGSFDAVVLIASIYILFLHEYKELKESVLQHFDWTIERFQAMQDRNPLAKAAQGVLRAIVSRSKMIMSNLASDTSVGSSPSRNKPTESSSGPMNPTMGPEEGFGYSEIPALDAAGGWSLPSANSLAMLTPMFPTGDIIYNDLNVVQNKMTLPLSMGGLGDIGVGTGVDAGVNAGADDLGWLFGGDLGNDTVWQLFNQFPQTAEVDGTLGAGEGTGA